MGEEESKAEGEAAKNQHIFLSRSEAVNTETKIKVFLKSTRFGARSNVGEGSDPAAADRTTESDRVEIFKSGAHHDAQLLDTFIGVVNVSTASAFEPVRARIGCLIVCAGACLFFAGFSFAGFDRG